MLQDNIIIGWDIGGVHTKATQLHVSRITHHASRTTHQVSRTFEIWREREKLPGVLQEIAGEMELEGVQAMAVTMTAELSDAFRTKREGVLFVLDAVERAFPHIPVYLLNLSGEFLPSDQARQHPLDFTAANWLASALFVASRQPDGILMDIGSTTTDIIPIQAGQVTNQGRTDTERLASGELVYTGVVRTNPNTLVSRMPIGGRMCRVAAEYFSVMGDVYLLLGHLSPEEYSSPTPDGRGKTPQEAAGRLARLVCADAEVLSQAQIRSLARYLHEKHLQQISEALFQVFSRLPASGGKEPLPLLISGAGRFLAAQVGQRLGLKVIDLAEEWGEEAVAVFPAAAVAHLLAVYLGRTQIHADKRR